MNRFAFKCPKCGAIEYSSTLRRVRVVCPKCSIRMIRSAKNDISKRYRYKLRCAGCGHVFSTTALIDHCPHCGLATLHYVLDREEEDE